MSDDRREFLRKEWHPTLNNGLTIDDVSDSSAKKIWWICSENPEHIWEARFFSRNKDGRRCPYCAGHKFLRKDSLGENFPKLLAEWDFERNKIDPFTIRTTDKKVWWICYEKGHRYQAYVHHRVSGGRKGQGTGCPYCSNQKVCKENSLENYPEIVKEFHPILNKKKPSEIIFGSREKIWIQCPISSDHVYEIKAYEKTVMKFGCPYCTGHRVCASNCLAATHPLLIKEWHPSNPLTIYQVTYASNKKVLWKCQNCSHEWKVSIYARTRGSKLTGYISLCPVCNASKGVQLIFDYLKSNNIPYTVEFKIEECRNIRPLPFDFAIFNSNGSLYGLIEYQGRYHYEPIEKFGGKEVLKQVQKRDKIKSDYCLNNNIKLLVIPYHEVNFHDLLDKFFKDIEN